MGRHSSSSHRRRRDDRGGDDDADEDRRKEKTQHKDRVVDGEKEERDRRKSSKRRHRHGDNDDEDDSRGKKRSHSSDKRRDHDRKRSKHGHKHRPGDAESDDSASDRKRHKKSDKKEKKSNRKHHRRRHQRDDSVDSGASYEKKKQKKSKHRSKDKHDDNDRIKKPDKTKLFHMGNPVERQPSVLIDAEQDYFQLHQEFWVYLFREEGVAFNDLDTKAAKKAFTRFSKRYNEGDLEEPYYSRKFPAEVLEESKTSKHSWSFNTSEKEREGLGLLQAGVRRQTEYDKDGSASSKPQVSVNASLTNSTSMKQGRQSVDRIDTRRHKTPEEGLAERRANKRLKESVRTTQEELAGGSKDFRERQLEKKREHAGRIHGASRDKEDGGAGVEVSDSVLFGDDERSSFQSALARERSNRERREQKKQSRIEELQSKEDERQKNMLKMLGLDGLKGQKIKIAPRKDG